MESLVINIGMKGFFLGAWVGDPVKGTRRQVSWPNPNVLLTAGLNAMGLQDNWMEYAQVGAGSSPAVSTQTGLESWIAGTNAYSPNDGNLFGAQGAAPYYGWRRVTKRFAIGEAAGNISELGMGWGASGATLISRQRSVDNQGTPNTFEVLPTEYLEVTYELRYYPPLADVEPGTPFNIGGVDYYTITRAALVTNGSVWGEEIGRIMTGYAGGVADWEAYDGVLGTVEQGPSGAGYPTDNTGSIGNDPYIGNSQEQVCVITVGASGWNVPGGVRSIKMTTTAGVYQVQFGTAVGAIGGTIPKTNGETMPCKIKIAWAEKVLP